MKKILVVDDEENIRLLYQDEFTDLGYQVFLATNGNEALEVVKSEHPDLVILELKMDGPDGIDTLRKIKEIDKGLPVVLSTAYQNYKHDFASWACDAYIVKSSDLKELTTTVQDLLD